MLYWYPYEGPLMPIYGAIFKHLIAKGHKVTIVTSFPHFRKGRSETWEEYRGKLFEKSEWEGATLIRTYVFAPVFNNQSKLSICYRAMNYVSFNLSSIIAGIFMTGKQDVIFAPSSPPLTNGVSTYIISLFKKIKIVYNVQDIYPDMAIKLGILRNKLLVKIFRYAERFVYKKVSKIIVLSEGMKKNLLIKDVMENKITIIPNFIDANFIKPMDKVNEFSVMYQLDNKFVVMYAGNIGLPHGVEFIIKAAETLRNENEILFCFVVRGEYKNKIINMCNENKLSNVLFIQPQSEKRIPQIWASSDVSLVTYRKGLSIDSVPSKMIACMASGRPIIAMVDEESEVYNILVKGQCGICVPPEQSDLLAKAILILKNDKDKKHLLGSNAREYCIKNLNKDFICQQYEDLLFNTTVRQFFV